MAAAGKRAMASARNLAEASGDDKREPTPKAGAVERQSPSIEKCQPVRLLTNLAVE